MAGNLLFRIQFLRHIRDFFQVIFKVEIDKSEEQKEATNGQQLQTGGDKLILTCLGVGYSNINKRIT